MLKKYAVLTLLLSFGIIASTSAQFRLGPTGGLNFNRQTFKSNSYKYEGIFKNRLGFHVGAISDLVLTPYLSLQSELIYTHRGGHYVNDRTNVSEEYKAQVGYLSMPICLTGKLDVKGAYLIAGVGPYLEKLIYSRHSYSSNGNNIENGSLRVGINNTTDQIKPWSAGVKLKTGFELKSGMYFVAFYDVGTADINPQFTITRNKTYGVQLGYIFSLTEEDRYNRFEKFYDF